MRDQNAENDIKLSLKRRSMCTTDLCLNPTAGRILQFSFQRSSEVTEMKYCNLVKILSQYGKLSWLSCRCFILSESSVLFCERSKGQLGSTQIKHLILQKNDTLWKHGLLSKHGYSKWGSDRIPQLAKYPIGVWAFSIM